MLLLSSSSFWPDNYIPLEFCLLALFVLIDLILLIVIFSIRRQIKKKNEAQSEGVVVSVSESATPPLLATTAGGAENAATTPQVIVINNGVPQQVEDRATRRTPDVMYVDNDGVLDGTLVSESDEEVAVTVTDTSDTDGDGASDANVVVLDEQSKIVDADSVIFKPGAGKTFDEAYAELSREQKSFLDELKEYAMSKNDAREIPSKSNLKIKIKGKQLIKFLIRRDVVIASFLLENEHLKSYRKTLLKNEGTKISVKSTDVPLYDLDAFESAKGLVDVTFEQIQEDFAQEKEERKERRRKARREKKAADNVQDESQD